MRPPMMLVAGACASLLTSCSILPPKEVICDEQCVPIRVAAPFVLGQPDDKTNFYQTGFTSPTTVLIVNGKLVVSDYGNSRILTWNAWPTANNQKPDVVAGRPTSSVVTDGIPSVRSVSTPTRITSDGTRLIIGADYDNRLIDFDNFFMPYPAFAFDATVMLPRPSITASNFGLPAPTIVNTMLYVADSQANRVLIYNALPSTMFGNADNALGQTDLLSGMPNGGTGAPSNMTLNAPDSPASDGTKLFVPDVSNHRVLIWNTLPTTNAMADLVLGQTTFTTGAANRGSMPGLGTLNGPHSVAAAANGHVAVADTGNNRVLLWNMLPATPGGSADVVLGQPSGASSNTDQGGVSASSMDSPLSVATDGNKLAVADTDNSRVLLWNNWPTTNGAPADVVLGQAEFKGELSNGAIVSSTRFRLPTGMARARSRLVVADTSANRVLIYSQFPSSAADVPAVVVGQGDFDSTSSNSGGLSDRSLYGPNGVASAGSNLIVADTNNHRVLIWNSIPTMNQARADVVLGQPNSSSNKSNNGGPGNGMYYPGAVAVYGDRLFVADSGNHRVLMWQSFPSEPRPADVVLGQSSLAGIDEQAGGSTVTANGMYAPSGVYVDSGKLYVSDSGNNRILIWNSLDLSNGQPPDDVAGPSSFTTSTSRLEDPVACQVANGRFYVVDRGNNRVLYWTGSPGLSNPVPTGVIGQPNMMATTANNGGLSVATLQSPRSIVVTDGGLYIADAYNSRVVALPIP